MPGHDYYMRVARVIAEASKDAETQVGAVAVLDGRIKLTGYNGPPMGVHDRPERLCRPGKYPWMSHAEQNIIAFAARDGVRMEGCTLYVTHPPCSNCARSIIQAGFTCVVIGSGITTQPAGDADVAMTMFGEAGVMIR